MADALKRPIDGELHLGFPKAMYRKSTFRFEKPVVDYSLKSEQARRCRDHVRQSEDDSKERIQATETDLLRSN